MLKQEGYNVLNLGIGCISIRSLNLPVADETILCGRTY